MLPDRRFAKFRRGCRRNYILQLIVNAGSVSSAPDTVLITTQNQEPIARTDSDKSLEIGKAGQLDGTHLPTRMAIVLRTPGRSLPRQKAQLHDL